MTDTKTLSPTWKLVISIFICEFVGTAAGFFTRSEISGWFFTLNKPSWNPPPYLFAPIWISLYFLMGCALWLVWKSEWSQPQKRNAMVLFFLQLFLNFCWSILFFKFHSPALALADILLLIVAIIATMFAFAPISRTASWLMVPYISWVVFASILNYSIWTLN